MYEVIRRPNLPSIMKDCTTIGLGRLDWNTQRHGNDVYRPSEIWRRESSEVSFIGNKFETVVSLYMLFSIAPRSIGRFALGSVLLYVED